MKRPAVWISLAGLSLASAFVAAVLFPRAFSIVALDITMDRGQALERARELAEREHFGPAGYREAASFTLDEETQTFVELEGGGKDAFTAMLRDGLYSAYTWQVRHFREGETNETRLRFTPDGQPYGFVERLREDAPGPGLDAGAARRLAEAGLATWRQSLDGYTLVEQGQERRPGGRVDHTLTYERAAPTLGAGRYRLRVVVSGDRLTELTHFVRIPEAFTRRYASMRSANEAIGVGSVVGMALLYVLGGIGAGLFVMLRRRMVIWRTPMIWGAVVSLLQVLAAVNEWPLVWMTYDTAVPRATFLAQQSLMLVVTFIGFTAFFGLSFMAAETLSRAAFPNHPQLWRVWKREPGSSTAVLGRTAGGFLLVAVFFAYDVLLYLFATQVLGWWSPAEALLHPDVLATYAPWLSAIANSLQAGFWEESLFRAVPLAGAALLGDRFGQRRPFLIVAFVLQAVIFGAGHAPYPNQPAFARPVELILPSFGFGLLYLYFGLLPGIVLHFAFDVVWFALPIFLSDAPGIRFQQFMIVALTLAPLWIVFWRRSQAGHWTTLAPADRNGAWQPPPAPERTPPQPTVGAATLAPAAGRWWRGLGVAGLIVFALLLAIAPSRPSFTASRTTAEDVARQAVAARGVTLDGQWRVLPVADNGVNETAEFVSSTAGDDVRRSLEGRYLPPPRWRVRIARFEGDVADRAEEWTVVVGSGGELLRVAHTLPKERPGAALDEAAARELARRALHDRSGLDPAAAREVSAVPSKQPARTDWTFTFVDPAVTLPQGDARVDVDISGDEVTDVGRYVRNPDDWRRQQRAAGTWRLALQILSGLLFAGVLAASAVLAVVAWSRRQFAPRLFVAGALVMLASSVVNAANGWPVVLASLSTAQPLGLQVAAVAGVGMVGLTLVAALVGLNLGAVPHRLASVPPLPSSEASRLGVAAGCAAAAAGALAQWLRTPAWASAPDLSALPTMLPWLDVTIDPITGFLTRLATLLALFTAVHAATAGWTRRRLLACAALLVIGFVGGGPPVGTGLARWAAAGVLTGGVLTGLYATLLRADVSMVPLTLGTMGALGVLGRGLGRPFPGALPFSVAAAALLIGLAWYWFGALRRARPAAGTAVSPGAISSRVAMAAAGDSTHIPGAG